MKHHLVSTGNQRLAESSPLDSVWGIGFRADDHRANDSLQWRGKVFLVEALSALREAIRERDTGWAHAASSGLFRTPTGNAGIHEISSAPQSCLLTAASFRSLYRTRRPTKARTFERLRWASALDFRCQNTAPASSGGAVTLDDVSFTTKIGILYGGDAIAPTDAWRSSILDPPERSSDVTCWIV